MPEDNPSDKITFGGIFVYFYILDIEIPREHWD